MRNKIAGLIPAVMMSGCAVMFSGTTQPMQITATKNNGIVAGAQCTATNDRGSYTLTAPGTTIVHKGHKALQISCKSTDDKLHGTHIVPSTYDALNLLNIPLMLCPICGIAGWITDYSTAATGEYVDSVTVSMQESAIS